MKRTLYKSFNLLNEEYHGKLPCTGCAKCREVGKNAKDALAESCVDANLGKVSCAMEIAKFGVFGTPAVVVDGEVKCVGKVPDKEEIKKWINN